VQRKETLIAVVEDEGDLLELIEYHLTKNGYLVEGFLSTKHLKRFLDEEEPDLLIIDRNLPGEEGSEFVHQLRQEGYDTPVIFLSAKSSQQDIELGFLRGGDDYISKPFNMGELLLRVKAILRRTKGPQELLGHRDILLNPAKREVLIGGERVELTKLEFDLLEIFLRNRGVVLSRAYLLDQVWRDLAQERSVTVAINRLREKIDPDRTKEYIEPVRGIGYKLR